MVRSVGDPVIPQNMPAGHGQGSQSMDTNRWTTVGRIANDQGYPAGNQPPNLPASEEWQTGGNDTAKGYQKVVVRISKERETLVVGTSHVARVEGALMRNGCNVVAIRGGRTAELTHFLNRSTNLGRPKNIIIVAGGNDVQDLNGVEGRELSNAQRVAENLEGLVKVCEAKFPEGNCVTGTIIPRMMGKGGGFRDRCLFVDQLEDIDRMIRQVNKSHHHYLTDALVSDRCTDVRQTGQGGEHKKNVRLGIPKVDLFVKDRVHLNDRGNVLFGRMIGVILDCLTFENFEGRHYLGEKRGEGAFLWKF